MLEWLFGEKEIKKGIVSRMWHEDAISDHFSLLPVPIYRAAVPERWMIEFRKDEEFRVVSVNQECYERYKIGDPITFDN